MQQCRLCPDRQCSLLRTSPSCGTVLSDCVPSGACSGRGLDQINRLRLASCPEHMTLYLKTALTLALSNGQPILAGSVEEEIAFSKQNPKYAQPSRLQMCTNTVFLRI